MFLVPEGVDPQGIDIRRLSIRPGDRLVIRSAEYLTDEQADQIKAAVVRAFEAHEYHPPVLLLDGGLELGVIGPEEGGS